MKKIIAIVFALLIGITFTGCTEKVNVSDNIKDDRLDHMVMINGILYSDTGNESDITERKCGTPDGEITSTVDSDEKPTQDNQSNFGTGYKYQYGSEGTIELYMNEKWWVFEAEPQTSELYSKEDIRSAIEVIKLYFNEDSGCTLTSIEYAGDEISKNHAEWAERVDKEEAIVLISSFDVDSSGCGDALNPNSTYDNYLWILARNKNEDWIHVDNGY